MAKLLTLTEQCSRGMGFRVVGNLLDTIISLFVGIIVARLLAPEEYGLFSIAFSIIILAEKFGSFGMLQALVQRQKLAPEHEAAAAIFQFSSAILISALLFFGAPLIDSLFRMPGLTNILRLQAGFLLVYALALLPESRLHRRLAFDRLSAIQVCEKALGGGITIFLAVQGYGAMALVIGSLTAAVIRTLLLWICAPEFVPLAFRAEHLRDLVGFGCGSLLINMATILGQRIDIFIAGRQIGSEAVGLYHRASHLVLLPLNFLMQPVNKVLFPAMSSVQTQHEKFRRGYLGAARLSAFVAFPLLIALWATADIIVPLVYGPQWRGTVPILQILALAGIFRILLNIDGIVIQARGQVMAQAARQGAWLVLVTVLGFMGSYFGILGLATGVILATFIFLISLTKLALSLANVRLFELLGAMRTGIIASVFVGLSIWLVKNFLYGHLSSVLLLLLMSSIGLLFYIIAIRSFITHEDRNFLELVCKGLPLQLANTIRLVFKTTVTPQASKATL
jgi:O-antigen/teichoic acid export membrane protein